MKGCRSTIRSLGSNDWIPLRIPMATGLERLHWVPREPNKQKRASMHPQPGRDSHKQQPRALWPFENVNFSIKKEEEKKSDVTWVKALQSMLALPTKKCLPSTTHNLVWRIPAPTSRLKSKLRTTAMPRACNSTVSVSGEDEDGWFWATRMRIPRFNPASFKRRNTSSPWNTYKFHFLF